MNVVLPKLEPSALDGDVPQSGAPGWFPTTRQGDRAARPFIRCDCGALIGIQNHHIHPDGRVTASLLHQDCGWHVFVTLADWDGRELVPGAEGETG